MSNTYAQVTALDRYGHRFKITCYPHVLTLRQQIEQHYKELYKTQFCKDNNLERLELINHIHEYLTSEHFKRAYAFSIINITIVFENERLNLSNYDHTIMDKDDVIDVYNDCKMCDPIVTGCMIELNCSIKKFIMKKDVITSPLKQVKFLKFTINFIFLLKICQV